MIRDFLFSGFRGFAISIIVIALIWLISTLLIFTRALSYFRKIEVVRRTPIYCDEGYTVYSSMTEEAFSITKFCSAMLIVK